MFVTRTRLRVQAALVAALLLLTGAGEVLGACYCEHRGGVGAAEHGGHGAAEPGGHAAAADPNGGLHGDHGSHAEPSSQDSSSQDPAGRTGEADGTADPASDACRALCALACTVGPNPAPDVWERAPDLRSSALITIQRPFEAADLIPVTARPHFLPFSQAPPANA